jgi:hypothetical protein
MNYRPTYAIKEKFGLGKKEAIKRSMAAFSANRRGEK